MPHFALFYFFSQTAQIVNFNYELTAVSDTTPRLYRPTAALHFKFSIDFSYLTSASGAAVGGEAGAGVVALN